MCVSAVQTPFGGTSNEVQYLPKTAGMLPLVLLSWRGCAGIKAVLEQLNGTDGVAVAMTGLSAEELDDLGGMPK